MITGHFLILQFMVQQILNPRKSPWLLVNQSILVLSRWTVLVWHDNWDSSKSKKVRFCCASWMRKSDKKICLAKDQQVLICHFLKTESTWCQVRVQVGSSATVRKYGKVLQVWFFETEAIDFEIPLTLQYRRWKILHFYPHINPFIKLF